MKALAMKARAMKALAMKALAITALWPLLIGVARAETDPPPAVPENWAVRGQSTFTFQYHPAFASPPIISPKTVNNGRRGAEDSNTTIGAGLRLWKGAEFWIESEVDQGFSLQKAQGIAGYVEGNAFKLSQDAPFWRLSRAFMRQTIGLGGERQEVAADTNVLRGFQDTNRIVVTAGKFSVIDIFDNNTYAHDPRVDFLNWVFSDSGAFDYATDPFGMNYGIAIEWYQSRWALRAGLFDMAISPEAQFLDMRFLHQVQGVLEAEERHVIEGRPGKFSMLFFANRGLMVKLSDYINLANATGTVPDQTRLRRFRTRIGFSLNFEQAITDQLGVFARASWADGGLEVLNFTDIDRAVAFGVSLKGGDWNRPDDVFGAGFAFNAISRDRLNFLRAGGQGSVISDGPGSPLRAAGEQIFEAFYNISIKKWLNLTPDYQLVNHPAYNVDRGPVHVFSLRLHAQI